MPHTHTAMRVLTARVLRADEFSRVVVRRYYSTDHATNRMCQKMCFWYCVQLDMCVCECGYMREGKRILLSECVCVFTYFM